jgi:hypothetical protein
MIRIFYNLNFTAMFKKTFLLNKTNVFVISLTLVALLIVQPFQCCALKSITIFKTCGFIEHKIKFNEKLVLHLRSNAFSHTIRFTRQNKTYRNASQLAIRSVIGPSARTR